MSRFVWESLDFLLEPSIIKSTFFLRNAPIETLNYMVTLLIRTKFKMYGSCERCCLSVYLGKRINKQVKRVNKDLYLFNALPEKSLKNTVVADTSQDSETVL